MSSRECKSYETQSSCSQQVPSTIHRLGTDEPLIGEKKIIYSVQMLLHRYRRDVTTDQEEIQTKQKSTKERFCCRTKMVFPHKYIMKGHS